MLRALVILGALAVPSHAFFGFFKKATGEPAALVEYSILDPNFVRGVPEHLQQNYKAEKFICDGGATILDKLSVNDDFCDCADGSDEPGTSACSNGAFYCINKGYKLIKLLSSRVDDGVCDCCDGSDEGFVIRCPNTCKEAADRERSAMQAMLTSYKLGSTLREQLVTTAKQDRARLIAQIDPLTAQISAQREEMKTFETKANEKEEQKKSVHQQVEKKLQDDALALLQLTSAPLEHLAQLLVNLIDLANKAEHELRQWVSFPIPQAYWSQSDDSEEADCDVVAAGHLGSITENAGKKLRLLCHAPDKEKELREIVFKLVKNDRLESEAMLLQGFYVLNQNLAGAVEFVNNHIASHGKDTCPVDFEHIGGHCELKTKLSQLIDRSNTFFLEDKADPELQRLKDDLDARRKRVSELERNLQEAEKARSDLEKYKDHLDLLAMKGQCFEVIDGKFSYNLCMLENIRQKEIEGNGNVSLGEFDSVEDTQEAGASFKLHFKNGQYCYAFGPRSADVTVVCGEKNVLKAAREPSTCFYTLVFESPSACTPQFALANGLTPYL